MCRDLEAESHEIQHVSVPLILQFALANCRIKGTLARGRTALVEYSDAGAFIATHWMPTAEEPRGAVLESAVVDGYSQIVDRSGDGETLNHLLRHCLLIRIDHWPARKTLSPALPARPRSPAGAARSSGSCRSCSWAGTRQSGNRAAA